MIWSLQQSYEVGTLITRVLQTEKMGHGEVKKCDQTYYRVNKQPLRHGGHQTWTSVCLTRTISTIWKQPETCVMWTILLLCCSWHWPSLCWKLSPATCISGRHNTITAPRSSVSILSGKLYAPAVFWTGDLGTSRNTFPWEFQGLITIPWLLCIYF